MTGIFVLRRMLIVSTIAIVSLLFFVNCSKDEGRPELDPEPEEPVLIDNHTYIALRNDGTLFEVGDESGKIKNVGKIPEIIFNIVFNTVTTTESTTYVYEQMPEIFYQDGTTTGFRGQLCELDRNTLSSKCTILDFSDSVFPEFAGLIALDWDEEHKRLVGLVRDVVNDPEDNPNYLVYIDPETLKINYSGIQFSQRYINSTCLVDNTYYISSAYANNNNQPIFSTLDLSTGVQNNINTASVDSPPFLLSRNKDSMKLFGLVWEFNTEYTNAAISITFDGVSQKFEKLTTPTRISFKQQTGKSFFNVFNDEQIALVNSEIGESLLRYNVRTNTFKMVQTSFNGNDLSSLVAIVNIKGQ